MANRHLGVTQRRSIRITAVTVAVGPLTLVLGPPTDRGASWLLVGTIRPDALAGALAELPTPAGLRR